VGRRSIEALSRGRFLGYRRIRNGDATGIRIFKRDEAASDVSTETDSATDSTRDQPTPWAALAGVTLALALFGAAQGLSYPLFTLLMQRQGLSPGTIGLSAAMMPIGLLLSAPLVPLAIRLGSARTLAVACALAGGLCFLLIGWLQNGFAWFALRFLLGVVINPLYILGEVWALALAPPQRRGRIMGVYNTMLSAGYALGPLTLVLVGSVGWPPFLVIVLGFGLCAAVLALVSGGLTSFDSPEEASSLGIVGFARIAPALLLAVVIAAANQQSTYSLLPVFGAAFGRGEALLATMLTVLSLSNIVLQIPLGLAAEKAGARAMILACAAMTAICALLLPLAINSPAIWPVLLVMGGVGYGVYTMALVELGNRFRGQALVAGNAAFALMWGAGGVLGPPLSGAAMQGIGAVGLPIVIAALSAGLLGFAAYREAARRRGAAEPLQEPRREG
jgi:MFS family permease